MNYLTYAPLSVKSPRAKTLGILAFYWGKLAAMVDYFRAGLARSSSAMPRSLTRKPYDWLFNALVQCTGLESTRVWTRNSLALDYWELGLSDLDLTIWVDGNIEHALDAWSQIRPWRSLLIGGEVQIYTSEAARSLVRYANPWELRRDPQLLRRLDLMPSFANPMHLTVFLARMLMADRGLLKYPWARQRKWRDHLRAMRLPHTNNVTWSEVVELLRARAPFQDFSFAELSETLQKTSHNSFEASGLDRLLNANHHVWDDIVQAEDRHYFDQYSDAAHDFLGCMVEWEIWGVSALTPVTKDLNLGDLKGFWRNQQRLIKQLRIDDSRRDFLRKGFDELAAYYGPLT